MPLSTNRGGAKPLMLSGPSRRDVPITIGRDRKFGIYERTSHVLARRVELPMWLQQGLERGTISLAGGRVRMPAEEIGESRGQIYLQPPRELFSGPAVGLDMEVFDLLEADEQIMLVGFYVYSAGYRLVDTWRISRQDFLRHAKLVVTKRSFMPQMMVPLSVLVARGLH